MEEPGSSVRPHLLSLPAEIREHIWSELLRDIHIHVRAAQRGSDLYYYSHVLDHNRPPLMALDLCHHSEPSKRYEQVTPLWLINRQMFFETRDLPFSSSNVFSFEDEQVLEHFVSLRTPEQVEKMTTIWLMDDAQSASAMRNFAYQLSGLSSTPRNLRIRIPSRCNKLEVLANNSMTGAMNITDRLRAGWELTNERKQVETLRDLWLRLGAQVAVIEL